MKEKILVGMSGGLDSAYCCEKLKEAGYQPVGAYLHFHSLSDARPARELAQRLGMELVERDVRELFQREVIGDFVSKYTRGKTPNPCAVCNRYAKLPGLCEVADELGIAKIATGHYVRVCHGKRTELSMAKDLSRDQSYFLWALPQEILARMVTPLWNVIKKEIPSTLREMICAGESRELCFAQSGYEEYLLSQGILSSPGEFVDSRGRVLGQHSGIIHYTVGQRKGLDIALGKRAYVLRIDAQRNVVVLGFEEEALCRGFTAERLNFVSEAPFIGERELLVKVRYGARPVKAFVKVEEGGCQAVFETPQKPVAPGQSAVFYKEGRLIFGGVIRESE